MPLRRTSNRLPGSSTNLSVRFFRGTRFYGVRQHPDWEFLANNVAGTALPARIDRLKTLFQWLPMTCTLLGDRLLTESERWTPEREDSDEVGDFQEFARHLREEFARQAPCSRALADVLEYELARHSMRSIPAGTMMRASRGHVVEVGAGVRLVHFRHDPAILLPLLSTGQRPRVVRRGDFYVVLVKLGQTVRTHLVDLDIGRLVWTLATAAPASGCERARRVLAEAGIV